MLGSVLPLSVKSMIQEPKEAVGKIRRMGNGGGEMLKFVLAFTAGFILAVALVASYNLPGIKKRRRKRKADLEEHPERKGGTTKAVLFSILVTYYIAFAVGVWVVVFKDVFQLGTLLTFTGGVTAAAVAFYCWKAKAENLLKIKAGNPELCGSLSDFSNMT